VATVVATIVGVLSYLRGSHGPDRTLPTVQGLQIDLEKCNCDLSHIKESIADDSSDYYYGATIANLDQNELMVERTWSGGPAIVDRLLTVRTDLDVDQDKYSSLVAKITGTKEAMDSLRQNLDQVARFQPSTGLRTDPFLRLRTQMTDLHQEVG
jgi:hypothetical protein